MSLPVRVLEYVRTTAMVTPGQTVAVAVSGGLDSSVLLDVLWLLRDAVPMRLVVATVDHRLREDSWEDARFVRDLARSRGLAVYSATLRVPAADSLEAAAREARLHYLAGVPADRVALAHHRDDQAETVLLRVVRGAGTLGLGAMAPVRLPFIRPLLQEPRAALRAWAEARGLRWRDDPTNQDVSFARNRLRAEVLPAFEAAFPGASARLAAMAEAVRVDEAHLDALASAAVSDALRDGCLNLCDLRSQPPAIQARVVRALASAAGAPPLTLAQTRAVERLAREGRCGTSVEVGAGWRIWRSEASLRCLPALPEPIQVRGTATLRWGLYHLRFVVLPGSSPAPVHVRRLHPGERWLGRPVREDLRRLGLPADLRAYHPVVEEPGGTRWIPGLPGAPVTGGQLGVQVAVDSAALGCWAGRRLSTVL